MIQISHVLKGIGLTAILFVCFILMGIYFTGAGIYDIFYTLGGGYDKGE